MSTLLNSAIQAVANQRGNKTALGLDRVDVCTDGTLLLSGVDSTGEANWYRYAAGELSALTPWFDKKLPLARHLREVKTGCWSVLAWRPGRRIVVQDRGSIGRSPILKGFRRTRSMLAAARHRAAYRATSATDFRVPALQAHDSERELLVFPELPGSPLDLSEHSVDNAFRIGAALAKFQAAEPCESLDIHTPADELEVIEHWFARRKRAIGAPRAEELDLLDELRLLAKRLPAVEPRLCHRDLHDGQFLVGSRGIALLDFDLLCLADPALDASNLLAHFSLRALQELHGATIVSSRLLGDALIEGLDSSAPDFWLRMRFYQAATFLRLSQLYALRPKWHAIVPDLFELAKSCTRETHAI